MPAKTLVELGFTRIHVYGIGYGTGTEWRRGHTKSVARALALAYSPAGPLELGRAAQTLHMRICMHMYAFKL